MVIKPMAMARKYFLPCRLKSHISKPVRYVINIKITKLNANVLNNAPARA